MKDISTPLSAIDTVLVDVDHVINHYGSGFARQFSVATATSFCELYPENAIRYDFEDCVKISVQSYAQFGRTTALFAHRHGAQEMHLYKHHHDALCEDGGYIHRQFRQKRIEVDPDLPAFLEQLKEQNVDIHAFTNGTQRYAEIVLGDRGHGISHYFNTILGIDSFGPNESMLDKRNSTHIGAALDRISGRFALADSGKVAIVDDTSANLRACRSFGIYTVLPLRRNRCAPQNKDNADSIVPDVKDFFKALISARKLA